MTRDWALARHLLLEGGVACIPPSAFHEARTKPAASNLIRFAFCKSDDSLAEAARRLKVACGKIKTLALRGDEVETAEGAGVATGGGGGSGVPAGGSSSAMET